MVGNPGNLGAADGETAVLAAMDTLALAHTVLPSLPSGSFMALQPDGQGAHFPVDSNGVWVCVG